MAGVPEEYADLTIPGPPVAKIKSACCIKYCVRKMLGSSIQAMMSFGAPALTASSNKMRAVSLVHFFARGCGEKIMPLRVLSEIKVLNITVEVGFVVGTTPAITPIGSANFINPFALSSSIIPQVLVSLYLL